MQLNLTQQKDCVFMDGYLKNGSQEWVSLDSNEAAIGFIPWATGYPMNQSSSDKCLVINASVKGIVDEPCPIRSAGCSFIICQKKFDFADQTLVSSMRKHFRTK